MLGNVIGSSIEVLIEDALVKYFVYAIYIYILYTVYIICFPVRGI